MIKISLLVGLLIIIAGCSECQENNGRCCMGNICSETDVMCDTGYKPEPHGCDEECT
ncbi:hypothetical protein K9M79_06220 [Candidatus Woesearchaeota archaeon]|nr:hypothetical protein [Candidatus Woesearchaeota archaeon]